MITTPGFHYDPRSRTWWATWRGIRGAQVHRNVVARATRYQPETLIGFEEAADDDYQADETAATTDDTCP